MSSAPEATRRTLATAAIVEGVGLFTEKRVRCSILPSDPGTGLCFRRTDLPDANDVRAEIDSLATTPVHPAFAQIPPRHTAVTASGSPEAVVYTTEHILAALIGMGITDARVELDGAEVPIDDGSAVVFTDAIAGAGVRDTEPPTHVAPLTIDTTIVVSSPDGNASITAEPLGPGERPSYRYELDYGQSAPVPPQSAEWHGDTADFRDNIAPARTFSLAAEAQQMQALGLFRSFSPKDLLVIDDAGTPIDNAWRGDAEPARHKLLDLIGDLALVGRPIHARVIAVRAGHALNHAMASALIEAGAD